MFLFAVAGFVLATNNETQVLADAKTPRETQSEAATMDLLIRRQKWIRIAAPAGIVFLGLFSSLVGLVMCSMPYAVIIARNNPEPQESDRS